MTQQSIRLGANEEPMRLATDTKLKLDGGQNVSAVISSDKVNINESLSAFVMIYDKNKKLIATSGMMGSAEPSYPSGVFDVVAKKGEDRVTWQTADKHRFASVAIKYNDGYIVAAKSLVESEKLIDTIGKLVLLAFTAFTICSVVWVIIIRFVLKKS